MVYVRLAKDWTDGNGSAHEAGDSVDVDAATLAELESQGIVTAWPGPTGGEPDWPGPTGGTTATTTEPAPTSPGGGGTTWPGPTGGGTSGGGTDWPGPTGGGD